jgi:hypothetical protein
MAPVGPVGPTSPISPVLANVIIMSSSAEKLEASPLMNEHGTLKYPVASVETAVIAKNAKSLASNLFEILK